MPVRSALFQSGTDAARPPLYRVGVSKEEREAAETLDVTGRLLCLNPSFVAWVRGRTCLVLSSLSCRTGLCQSRCRNEGSMVQKTGQG